MSLSLLMIQWLVVPVVMRRLPPRAQVTAVDGFTLRAELEMMSTVMETEEMVCRTNSNMRKLCRAGGDSNSRPPDLLTPGRTLPSEDHPTPSRQIHASAWIDGAMTRQHAAGGERGRPR